MQSGPAPARTWAHGHAVAAYHPGAGHLHGERWLALRHKDATQYPGQLRQPLKPLQPLLLLRTPRHLCQLLLHLLGPDLHWVWRVVRGQLCPLHPIPGLQTLTRSNRSWDTPLRGAGGVAGGVAGNTVLDTGLLGTAVRRAKSFRAFSIWSRSERRDKKSLLAQPEGRPLHTPAQETLYVQPKSSQHI